MYVEDDVLDVADEDDLVAEDVDETGGGGALDIGHEDFVGVDDDNVNTTPKQKQKEKER